MAIGIESAKLDVYTYWIDQETFRPLDKRVEKEKLGLQNRFVVLFVGRLIPAKGIDRLLEAAKMLCDQNNIQFVFAGGGPMVDDVKRAAKTNKQVLYVGSLNSEELVPYYNAADVRVVPYVSEEGFGQVILEALSCGTPVIASNRGGIPEAIDNTVGILVEPKPEKIKEAIISVYENPDLRNKMQKRCRVYAEKRYGAENVEVILRSYE